ncbi:hypothetical protein CFP56_002647 [Quercus suber]|uniref:Uncharacterized protein n=1 Tax=Quercus suber TaxID=58331 RepID=A0AAW0LFD6_QUESU
MQVRAIGVVGWDKGTQKVNPKEKPPKPKEITINIHASLTFMFTALGVHTIPSMNVIYAII